MSSFSLAVGALSHVHNFGVSSSAKGWLGSRWGALSPMPVAMFKASAKVTRSQPVMGGGHRHIVLDLEIEDLVAVGLGQPQQGDRGAQGFGHRKHPMAHVPAIGVGAPAGLTAPQVEDAIDDQAAGFEIVWRRVAVEALQPAAPRRPLATPTTAGSASAAAVRRRTAPVPPPRRRWGPGYRSGAPGPSHRIWPTGRFPGPPETVTRTPGCRRRERWPGRYGSHCCRDWSAQRETRRGTCPHRRAPTTPGPGRG